MKLEHCGPTATLPDGTRNPLSHIVRAGDTIYFSGLMPKSEDGKIFIGNITDQTHSVMRRLQSMLEQVDCDFSDLVKVNVWLTDAADFKAFNAAYATYFSNEFPARSAVRSDLLLPGARVELEAIAYRPSVK